MNEIEKAIRIIKEYIDNCTSGEEEQDKRAFYLAISALEAQQADAWIPVEERLPECEEKVWVTIERHRGDKIYKFTCLAIYEDGNMWDEDSGYSWNNFDNAEYDEEREDFKVPRGWYESVYYAEEFSAIDDFVIAWMPLIEPYDALKAGLKRVLDREHDRISGKE